MERVAGVGGCKGGWVGAVWDGEGIEWRALPLPFGEALAALDGTAAAYGGTPLVIHA